MPSFERLVLGHSSGCSKVVRRKWTGDLSRSLNRDTVGLGERQYSCGSDFVDDQGWKQTFCREQEVDVVLAWNLDRVVLGSSIMLIMAARLLLKRYHAHR